MGMTFSHTTALRVTRKLRLDGVDLRYGMDHVALFRPSPWVGKRWGKLEFASHVWQWPVPSSKEELHILVPSPKSRVRMEGVHSHVCKVDLPAQSILWLDQSASMVCPELLYVQMAELLSLPQLVLLGNELCGCFSLTEHTPYGSGTKLVSPSTSKEDILSYIASVDRVLGSKRACQALEYVLDGAASFPEAVLATMYTLPVYERGYGMGPIQLNKALQVNCTDDPQAVRYRIPDILFPFAPVGINYDGEGHFDARGLLRDVRAALHDNSPDDGSKMAAIESKTDSVRTKIVDDIRRNRELLASGYTVLPATKEDLYSPYGLDNLTAQLLACSHNIYGVNVRRYESQLNDAALRRDRRALLRLLLSKTNDGVG